jgi:hypothetical protein
MKRLTRVAISVLVAVSTYEALKPSRAVKDKPSTPEPPVKPPLWAVPLFAFFMVVFPLGLGAVLLTLLRGPDHVDPEFFSVAALLVPVFAAALSAEMLLVAPRPLSEPLRRVRHRFFLTVWWGVLLQELLALVAVGAHSHSRPLAGAIGLALPVLRTRGRGLHVRADLRGAAARWRIVGRRISRGESLARFITSGNGEGRPRSRGAAAPTAFKLPSEGWGRPVALECVCSLRSCAGG